jgi:hypothetical protein
MADLPVDVVVVGASFGGVAAALAAANYEKSVALIDAGGIVGGQATSQGVTRWDETEHSQTPKTYGSTKSYRTLKDDIRGWYRANATLAPGVDGATFNPGFYDGVHPFSVDCNIAMTVLDQLLADKAQYVTLILNTRVTGATVNNGTISSLNLANGDTVSGKVVVDATDLGELLPMCNISWFIGAEAHGDTQEPNAEAQATPGFIQPFTVPIAVERRPDGEENPIAQPDNYDELVTYQAFAVVDPKPYRNGMIGGVFTSAHRPTSEERGWETVFNYRQYIDHRNFNDPDYATDRTTINVGCNDYQAEVIPTGDATADAAIVERARQVSRAYLWWLQNLAPHDDGNGHGYKNLKVRTDIFGRADGTAPQPYIRESRRIAKPFVPVREQDITAPKPHRAPTNFKDSVGIGHYPADVHACHGPPGTPYKEVGNIGPFQIPLGALVPKDASNYIAGCKNLGATHLSAGAYRVHPIEWAIGEAAGTLAAYCAGQGVTPAAVATDKGRVADVQLRLLEKGAPIFWWDDVKFEDDARAFAAMHLLGARGTFEGDGQTLKFNPGGDFPQAGRDAIDQRENHAFNWPARSLTRAEAAVLVCEELGLLGA